MQDVLGFAPIDATLIGDVGGKGAHLGELSRLDGVRVPDGFCVTTHAYRRVVAREPALEAPRARPARVAPDGPEAIRALDAANRWLRQDLRVRRRLRGASGRA